MLDLKGPRGGLRSPQRPRGPGSLKIDRRLGQRCCRGRNSRHRHDRRRWRHWIGNNGTGFLAEHGPHAGLREQLDHTVVTAPPSNPPTPRAEPRTALRLSRHLHRLLRLDRPKEPLRTAFRRMRPTISCRPTSLPRVTGDSRWGEIPSRWVHFGTRLESYVLPSGGRRQVPALSNRVFPPHRAEGGDDWLN